MYMPVSRFATTSTDCFLLSNIANYWQGHWVCSLIKNARQSHDMFHTKQAYMTSRRWSATEPSKCQSGTWKNKSSAAVTLLVRIQRTATPTKKKGHKKGKIHSTTYVYCSCEKDNPTNQNQPQRNRKANEIVEVLD